MFQRGGRRAGFPVVLRGYDRDQVDTLVGECERWRAEWWRRRVEITSKQAEADRRVQALEASSELAEKGGAVDSWLAEMANDLLDRTDQVGRELQRQALSEVEVEQEKLTHARETVRSARAHAEEIVAMAERDRDQLSRSVEESHRQINQFLEEGKIAAKRNAQEVWERTQDRLREPVFELERIHEQRRMVLKEVTELEELVATSWRRITCV